MEDPDVSSGVPGDKDPDEELGRLVRPYVGSGAPDPLSEAGDGNASAWFPAAPVDLDTAPRPASAAAAAERLRSGVAGRHRLLTADPHRFLTRSAVSGIASAGIAALAVGVFFAWPTHPDTVLTRDCQPGGCGGTASQAPGTVPLAASSGAGARPTGNNPGNRGVTVRATSYTAAPGARSASAASANATPIAKAAPGTTVPPGATVPSGTVPSGTTGAPGGTATAPETATATVGPPPSPGASASQLNPGSVISINATTACCTMFYIRHDDTDDKVVITEITAGSAALDKADATWLVQAGLADSACVSFESANDLGRYLRQSEFELYLEPGDGSSQFARDATFCPQPGNSGTGYSFQSVSYRNQYIRHLDYVVYIASDGGTNAWDGNLSVWPEDTSWLVTRPWG